MHQDGFLPFCKKCIKEQSYDYEKDDIDLGRFKDILRQMDRPFVSSAYIGAVNQYNKNYENKNVSKGNKAKIIGYYFKNIQMPQYKTLSWADGLEWENKSSLQSNTKISTNQSNNASCKRTDDDDFIYYLNEDDGEFRVTNDIIKLFGEGYKRREYKAMWDKYNFIKTSYPDVTNLHVEALITYVRFKVKEEIATAKGNVAEAKEWSAAATKAAEKAKINPSQLSKSDLQGGMNSFCELLMAVEEAVDIIPILPEFKFKPKDAIDFNIYCIINYLRDLEGKPLCDYEDIYKFYDERKREYIEDNGDPYGIFSEDPSEGNRDLIKKFITLPKDYNEYESESSDSDSEK